MALEVHARAAAFRRMGPVAGTKAGVLLVTGPVRRAARRQRLAWRPLAVSSQGVRRALGAEDPVARLRGPVLAAMPTAAAFERDPGPDIIVCADEIVAHRFELLGSGPTELGPVIDWQRDFKSGRKWPAEHISRLPIVLGDGSDVKVPWELSRFQHLPLLAAAGQKSHLEELGAQLTAFIAANPVEHGPCWACTMDVGIRAANWVAALAIAARDEGVAAEPWFGEALASLVLHGRFIRSHLEWAPVRGNHYLSDVVGLLYVAALFASGSEGGRWLSWAAGELEAEMFHQVREDGTDHEASIPYHRLVCELFLCGAQVIDAMVPGRLSDAFHERLERMLAFTAAYIRPDGLAPQVGDADDGRFLPLADYGADPRDHRHLFRQAGRPVPPPPAGAVEFPAGGYWVLREGELYCLLRCGDVGVGGTGSHSHCDQLSFELAVGDQPVVVDAGSYLYTADPQARNAFRSTAFHATLEVDGHDQNPVTEALFAMEDHTRAELLSFDGGAGTWTGRHHGYERLAAPAVHTRTVTLRSSGLVVDDLVESSAAHDLRWSFPLAEHTEVAVAGGTATIRTGGVELVVAADGVELAVEPGWLSPSYGVRRERPVLRARRRSVPGKDRQRFTFDVVPGRAS